MTWLSDAAVARLRTIADRPDFSGTRYELLEELGRGGMGIVFRARDRDLDREVAIKVAAWSTDDDADRLMREAKTLAALEHPGIVPVHEVGRLADGRVFAVMLRVRGEQLDAFAGPLALPDRLRLFDRLCNTIAFAHARGVVHRDLKPANIMVGEFGEVRVLDWGLAVPGPGRGATLSRSGTEGYMAPEQSGGVVDGRTDVYALGAILRDLSAGDPGRHLAPLRSIVQRAMADDPASRYATPDDLAAAVRRFVDGEAVRAHREDALDRVGRLARTYRTPIVLVATYLAMRLVLLFWR